MKKSIYLFLLLFIPFAVNSQTLFRSGTFLHHSTGLNIWGPNGSSTSIPLEITAYNTSHGYSGTNAVAMGHQWWPSGGDNEWEYWHRIFDNQVSGLNIVSVMNNNKIVVIKSCFPSSEMTGMGQATDTLTYTIKSMYNYKWHWRHIINVMAQRPQNFFVIWTNAPHVQGNTNANAAMLTKKFTTWAKDTLAQGLDPVMGAFPPNVYVFNYFAKLTDANGYQLPQYAVSSSDSHPNEVATALVAPQFVNEIFNAAIAYEQGGSTLSVAPSSQQVLASAGSTAFSVTTTASWTAQSNAGWCTVTPSGSGNGTITANYTANVSTASRTATITVSASGVSNQVVTVVQAGVAATLSVSPASQQVGATSGSTAFSVTSNAAWTAQSNAAWCTVTPSGTGNGTITANYTANASAASRTATITVSATGVGNQTVTVVQAGAEATLNVSPASQQVPATSGSTAFAVASNAAWTAQSNAGWCTVTPSGSGNGTITANYTVNVSTASRTATITVSATGMGNQVVTVVQAGTAATLAVSPASQQVGATSGSTAFSVTSNAAWTAQSNAAWCTVTPSGTGNGTITANYTVNTSSVYRTATITVSATGVDSQVVTVVQAGAAATLAVSPESQNVPSTAGAAFYTVTSNTDWTAQSDAGWCVVTPEGSGNSAITASYDENNGTSARTATITVSAAGVGNQVVTLVQIGSDAALSVAPLNRDVSFESGNTTFSVTSNLDWTVESDAVWCEVTAAGSGSGIITATYQENTATTLRLATITVSAAGIPNQTVTLTQAAAPVALAVNPLNQDVSAAAGNTVFSVTSNADWLAESEAGWCLVTPGGSGNGNLIAVYQANQSNSPRTAYITISAAGVDDQVVTVSQAGADPLLMIDPNAQSVPSTAGSTTFSVTSNSTWSVQSDAAWCVVNPSGSGNGEIVAAYEENPQMVDRTANIEVLVPGLGAQVVTVTQVGLVSGTDNSLLKGIQLYPNPSQGIIHLVIEDVPQKDIQVVITNAMGREVMIKTYQGGVSEIINLKGEGSGLYTITVSIEGELINRKIIVQ